MTPASNVEPSDAAKEVIDKCKKDAKKFRDGKVVEEASSSEDSIDSEELKTILEASKKKRKDFEDKNKIRDMRRKQQQTLARDGQWKFKDVTHL